MENPDPDAFSAESVGDHKMSVVQTLSAKSVQSSAFALSEFYRKFTCVLVL